MNWRHALSDVKNRPSEFDLIERLFSPLTSSHPGAENLKDDCSTLSISSGCEALYSVDTLVEGIHFFSADPAESVAKKMLRVSLSDIAASGGSPRGYLIALSLPKDVSLEWLEGFSKGLADDQKKFNVVLLGGDTTSTSGPLTLSLTAIGEVPIGQAVRRSKIEVGDDIYVTGTIGDSALALRLINEIGRKEASRRYPKLLERYILPQPRVTLGPLLIGLATSCIDISDGLCADLNQICKASNVSAEIRQAAIPLSLIAEKLVKNNQNHWQVVLGGGDDYELLFTANQSKRKVIKKLGDQVNIPFSRLGSIKTGEGVFVLNELGDLVLVDVPGWKHF